MGVARRCAMAPVPEESADQRQAFSRHHGLTCGGMPQVMQSQSAEIRIRADGALAVRENPETSAFGMLWKQERIEVACTGKRADVRPRGFAERHRARAGLGVRQIDGVGPNVVGFTKYRTVISVNAGQ